MFRSETQKQPATCNKANGLYVLSKEPPKAKYKSGAHVVLLNAVAQKIITWRTGNGCVEPDRLHDVHRKWFIVKNVSAFTHL